MLHIKEITQRVEGRLLFDRATAVIHKGERVGFVGRNGTGKSTILRLITGALPLDGGEIAIPRGATMGTVAQDAPSGATSLVDTVLAADVERSSLLAEAETAKDPGRIAEIHERLATIKAETAPARAARILAGLGFSEEAQNQPCSSLSGGWRMRVALAALLFTEPDLLLLDEPTNHLDLEATLWLEGYLKGYPGTLLLVSHDRNLLNNIAQRTLHLDQQKLTIYNGNYDRFERTRRENQERQAAMRTKQIAERRHIESFVERFRAKASKARQAQSRLKALARMEPIASAIEDRTTIFEFPAPTQLSPPLINLEDVSVGYSADKPILTKLNLRIDMDDRIALLGANGNGKSTFIKLLASQLNPLKGRLVKSSKLKIGYFSQDQSDVLDLDGTPLEHMARALPMEIETRLRSHLGRFGFGQDHVSTKVGKLSGGEKARLLFALMTRDKPHILLLDEPTNHLDVDARQALIQAINGFEGAVILVSHDPHLIELSADRLWLVTNGGIASYDGDMESYKQLLLDQRRDERTKARKDRRENESGPGKSGLSKKDKRKAAADARAAASDLHKRVKAAEQKVAKLERRKQDLEIRLADPRIYDRAPTDLEALQIEFGQISKAIADAERTWLEAQSALEST
jgi:ATP-binding cassette subfamily F protein 3